MKFRLILAAAAVALAACQPAAKAPPPAPAITAEQSAAMATKLATEGGELTGVLTTAVDAGYPMFSTVFTLDGGATVEALFNNEAATVEGDDIGALVGKPVVATITMVERQEMKRIDMKGKAVLTPETESGAPTEIPADAKTITGRLTGAKEPGGDLPNEITVTAKDGTAVVFEAFPEPKLEALEGKEVTLTYAPWKTPTVTALKAAPVTEDKK
jgi:hypothetical protein